MKDCIVNEKGTLESVAPWEAVLEHHPKLVSAIFVLADSQGTEALRVKELFARKGMELQIIGPRKKL